MTFVPPPPLPITDRGPDLNVDLDRSYAGGVGARWLAETGPAPTDEMLYRAQRSAAARREADLAWAAYYGIPEDEVEGFLASLAAYDRRSLIATAKREREELEAAIAETRRTEARRAVRPPRVFVPRVAVPG